MKKNKAINSKAYEFALKFIDPSVKILGAKVENKWLVLKLDSGVYFKVLN